MPASIDIVIVNWNAGTQLRECLDSIGFADERGVELRRVVLVDNGSRDASLDAVDAHRKLVTVIRNDTNRGFATACNQGAEDSTADYLLFLNPDARLLVHALARPVAFMEQPEHQHVGIVGIQLINGHGEIAPTCARFPTTGRFIAAMLGLDRLLPSLFPPHFMREWDHLDSREVDQIMGAYFLVRRSAFEALGGFDERFFVYFEEVDFSLRAHLHGIKSFYLSTAQAYHRGGGVTEQAKPARLFYSLRSRILYGSKHFSKWSAMLLTLATLFLEPVSRTLHAIARWSLSEVFDIAIAYALLWRALARGLGGGYPEGHN